jgi:NADPH-dependent curcumin reductase CurA
VHAFNRYAYKELYPSVMDRLGELLRAKKLAMHNSVVDGMESTPAALNQLLSGQHIGKVLVNYTGEDGARI